jgi:hypothetical protein
LAHFSIGHKDRSLAEGQAITMRNAAMALFVKQELIRTLFGVGWIYRKGNWVSKEFYQGEIAFGNSLGFQVQIEDLPYAIDRS